jgi:hypothetical protein
MALLELPMYQKSPWDKVLGKMLIALAGTLGGAAILVAGVTTLRSCDESRDSLTWVLIPQVRPAHILHPPWEMIHLPREIDQ